MPIDSTTNIWLGVIAICSVVQLAGVITAVVYVSRLTKKASETMQLAAMTVARLEQRTIPLMEQVSACLEDVSDLASRVKRADDMTQAAVAQVSESWNQVKTVAQFKLWPVLTVLRGAKAAWSAFSSRSQSNAASEDQEADARFVYEGGAPARHVR